MTAMAAAGDRASRNGDVWAQLGRVTDPELDEPITDMGFVESVTIGDDRVVDVAFRLPTYWCSPNFAFLMASDIRAEIEKLPWVTRARVKLEDHLCADQVNHGVNEGLLFGQVFADSAPDEDLHETREQFREKAFQRRQEAVFLSFRRGGFDDGQIVTMTLEEFDSAAAADDETARQKVRYRDILGERGLAGKPADLAFPSYDGKALEISGLAAYLSALRGTRINMEFGGSLCRALLGSRDRESAGDSGEPTLADFMPKRGSPASAPDPNATRQERTQR